MIDPFGFKIQFTNLHCYDEGDSIGNAEPYLWVAYFKIDGDSTVVSQDTSLQGTAKVTVIRGDHGDLGTTDVGAGDDVPIPDQFSYEDTLRPIPFVQPLNGQTETSGVVGCIAILLEQDDTSDSAVALGHAALGPALQKVLDDMIPTLNAFHQSPTDEEIKAMEKKVDDAVHKAIANGTGVLDWLFALGNMDDKIGDEVFKFWSQDLLDSGPSGKVLDKRWPNEGDWEITGHIWVNWAFQEDLGGPPAPLVNKSSEAPVPEAAKTVTAPETVAAAETIAGEFIPPGPIVTSQQLNSAPAVASWNENRLDCFARGVDNHMWQKSWNGSVWSDWKDLDGPPVPPVNSGGQVLRAVRRVIGTGPLATKRQIASAPAAFSCGENRIDTFVRGLDRAMWHRWWDGSKWSDWEYLGGSLNSGPAVASWGENRLDCFVQGPSNHLWHKYWDGAAWSDWEDLGGILTAAPAAVSWGTGRIDTFVRGTDFHMWHKWFEGGWSGWEDLGGILTTPVAVSSRSVNTLDCFTRGTDGRAWFKSWNGAAWSDWINTNWLTTDTPAVVSKGSNRINIFVRNANNHMLHGHWG